ncbi:uncharacterized protein [Tenebrio molitor]|uniref:uncharacterized protein isoform X2 n=1 Tax=Tenebrio molitor TaxID=7067 RepID=UPI0036249134
MQTIMPFLIVLSCLCITEGDWVDPHSMDSNSKTNLPQHDQNYLKENPNKGISVKKCTSDIHLRRVVRLILNNAYLDFEDIVGYHQGYLHIKLTPNEHQFLLNFSRSVESEDQIFNDISSILENALQKTPLDKYQEAILSAQENLYLIIFNPTSGALVSACLALYITYKLLKANFTWMLIIKYFLFLMYIADFVITYLHLIQEEEINNMVLIKKLGSVPPECDPQKMSWWTYMKTQFESTFGENPCKAFYQATFQNYKYFVAPSKVLTRQFKTLIVEPCGNIGEAFGKFGRGMFTSLPWGLNAVLFPIMLISSCAIIFIIFLFITKPQFKLSLFHLFTIELGQPARVPPRIENRNESNGRGVIYVGNRRVIRHRRNGNNTRESF